MAKFHVGERARIRFSPLEDAGHPEVEGKEVDVLSSYVEEWEVWYVVRLVSGTDCFGTNVGDVLERDLQKLLPDKDTYHPADISIDDLMQSVRTREVA